MNEFKQYLIDFIKQNFFKLITTLALILGGFFLLIYFFHVEYFPTNVRLSDMFLILLLSCFVGLFFITLIVFALILPVINYQSSKKLSQFEKRIKDRYLKTLPKNEIYNPQLKLLFIPLSVFVIFSIPITYFVFSKKEYLNGYIGFLILILITLLAIIFVFRKQFEIAYPQLKLWKMYKSTLLYTYIKQVFFSIFFISFSFIISYPIMTNSRVLKDSEYLLIIGTAVFMLSFIFLNIIEQHFFKRIILNIGILFMFLIVTKTIHIVPYMIVKSFNLGQVKIDQISIDSKGCQIINPKSTDKYCIERNIRLVWKLGNEYVFDKPLDKNNTSFKRYGIPSNSILSTEQYFLEKKNKP